MDLTNLERVTGRPISPACSPTDERLDVLIEEVRTLIAETRITREEWKKAVESLTDGPPEFVTVDHYKDIPPMDVPGRKPPKRTGK